MYHEAIYFYFQNNILIIMNVFSFKYRNIILGIAASAVAHYAIIMPHTVFLNKYRFVMARYQ